MGRSVVSGLSYRSTGTSSSKRPRIAVSFTSVFCHSASGSEPATIPQPAYSRRRLPSMAAQGDAPFAVPVGVLPSHRGRVPAAVGVLQGPDEVERAVGGSAADRRRGVERSRESEGGHVLVQGAGDAGGQVGEVGNVEEFRLGAGVQFAAEGAQRVRAGGRVVAVFLHVLRGADRAGAARPGGAGQDDGGDPPSRPADEELGCARSAPPWPTADPPGR